jgi:hypothetical protein
VKRKYVVYVEGECTYTLSTYTANIAIFLFSRHKKPFSEFYFYISVPNMREEEIVGETVWIIFFF